MLLDIRTKTLWGCGGVGGGVVGGVVAFCSLCSKVDSTKDGGEFRVNAVVHCFLIIVPRVPSDFIE